MRVKKTNLDILWKNYSHPCIVLFRSIELKALYEQLKEVTLRQPSLDLGCGDGKIAQLIFDEQFTYGVDNGEADDVEIAIKNKVYKKVLIESAEKMSLPDSSVDFVFSNSVIEHIPGNEAVLSEVARILKKNGDFVFTSPSNLFTDYLYMPSLLKKLGLGFLGNQYCKKRNQMLNHFHIYSHVTWEKKLKKHGLKLVKHAYYIPKPTLYLWDKMAFLIYIARFFNMNIEDKIASRYKSDIRESYIHGTDDPIKGASVFIHAIKE